MLGDMLADTGYVRKVFGNSIGERTASYVTCYIGICVVALIIHSLLKKVFKEKVSGSNAFGSGEYYLGMVAGAFRYACIILVLLALMNARQYTQQEIQSQNAFQETNFGAIRFPTLISFQSAVFERSFTGSMARNYLSTYLIRPTVPEEKGLSRNGVARARERMVNDVLDKH